MMADGGYRGDAGDQLPGHPSRAPVLGSGVFPATSRGVWGNFSIRELPADSLTVSPPTPRPHQFPAALPFSQALEPRCIFGNWSLGRAWRIWIRGWGGEQAAGKLTGGPWGTGLAGCEKCGGKRCEM